MQRLGPAKAVAEGWSMLRRNPFELLGGLGLFTAVLAIFCMLPVPGTIRWPLLAIVVFPLLGGLLTLFLKADRNTSPRLTDIFCGFPQFWKWFSTGWTYTFVFNAFLIPCLLILIAVAALVAYSLPGEPALNRIYGMHLKTIALMLAPLPASLLFAQYAFMPFVTVEGSGVNRSATRSQALVNGKPFRLRLTIAMSILLPYTLLVIGYIAFVTGANAFGWFGWAAYAVGTTSALAVALSTLTCVFVSLDDESRTATV